MKAIILNSNLGTRFRFGKAMGAFTEETHNTQKTTSEYLHSDTLWSALVNAWTLTNPETVNKFISACNRGEFKLTSAFYSYHLNREDNSVIYFLPKPVSLNLSNFAEPKRLKRIKFISKGVWESGLMPEDWFDKEKCTLLQKESIVALRGEINESVDLYAIEKAAKTSARNITDREDVFYFQTDLYLMDRVKWYFLVEDNMSEDLQKDFQMAMSTLINLGIGGERTTGCGSLSGYNESDFNIELKESSKDETGQASLSLVTPTQDELCDYDVYQTIKRGGRFFEKGKSLPMIQMLLEGAVLNKSVRGRIVELNNSPKILRYGLNYTIPLHSNFHTSKF